MTVSGDISNSISNAISLDRTQRILRLAPINTSIPKITWLVKSFLFQDLILHDKTRKLQ